MSDSVRHEGIGEVPAIAWNNNSTVPIVLADVGKPVRVATATGRDVILAAAGEDFIGFVGAVNVDASVISVIQDGCVETTCPTDATAPIVTGTAGVVADGNGGVKKSTNVTNWRCSYVSSAVCEVWRR